MPDSVLLDTSVVVAMERGQLPLTTFAGLEVFICGATVAEWLMGAPVKDAGKQARFQKFWQAVVSHIPTVALTNGICEDAGLRLAAARAKGKTITLGDGLHAAASEWHKYVVATLDLNDFEDLGAKAYNPLKSKYPPRQAAS